MLESGFSNFTITSTLQPSVPEDSQVLEEPEFKCVVTQQHATIRRNHELLATVNIVRHGVLLETHATRRTPTNTRTRKWRPGNK